MVQKEKHDIYTANKINIQVNKTTEIPQKEPLNDTKSHTWPNDTCLIIGDSIVLEVKEKLLSKRSKLVKVCDFKQYIS